MKDFIRKHLVADWQRKLYKDLSTYMIALGVFLPDLINFAVDNLDLVSSALGMTTLDDGYKSGIRLGFLLAAFVAKFVKQYKTPDEKVEPK